MPPPQPPSPRRFYIPLPNMSCLFPSCNPHKPPPSPTLPTVHPASPRSLCICTPLCMHWRCCYYKHSYKHPCSKFCVCVHPSSFTESAWGWQIRLYQQHPLIGLTGLLSKLPEITHSGLSTVFSLRLFGVSLRLSGEATANTVVGNDTNTKARSFILISLAFRVRQPFWRSKYSHCKS